MHEYEKFDDDVSTLYNLNYGIIINKLLQWFTEMISTSYIMPCIILIGNHLCDSTRTY